MKRFPEPSTLIERYNERRVGSAMSENNCSRPQYFHGDNRVAKKRERFTYKGQDYDVMTPVPPPLERIAKEYMNDYLDVQIDQMSTRSGWRRG